MGREKKYREAGAWEETWKSLGLQPVTTTLDSTRAMESKNSRRWESGKEIESKGAALLGARARAKGKQKEKEKGKTLTLISGEKRAFTVLACFSGAEKQPFHAEWLT